MPYHHHQLTDAWVSFGSISILPISPTHNTRNRESGRLRRPADHVADVVFDVAGASARVGLPADDFTVFGEDSQEPIGRLLLQQLIAALVAALFDLDYVGVVV
jgi:hypothetical protein